MTFLPVRHNAFSSVANGRKRRALRCNKRILNRTGRAAFALQSVPSSSLLLERGMTGHIFGRLRLLPFVVAAILLCGAAGAVHAQTIGPDEAVTPQGRVTQTLALTEAQKSAIYN